jgi:hypothetical protein
MALRDGQIGKGGLDRKVEPALFLNPPKEAFREAAF